MAAPRLRNTNKLAASPTAPVPRADPSPLVRGQTSSRGVNVHMFGAFTIILYPRSSRNSDTIKTAARQFGGQV